MKLIVNSFIIIYYYIDLFLIHYTHGPATENEVGAGSILDFYWPKKYSRDMSANIKLE